MMIAKEDCVSQLLLINKLLNILYHPKFPILGLISFYSLLCIIRAILTVIYFKIITN